jgi:hypothetical protein
MAKRNRKRVLFNGTSTSKDYLYRSANVNFAAFSRSSKGNNLRDLPRWEWAREFWSGHLKSH